MKERNEDRWRNATAPAKTETSRVSSETYWNGMYGGDGRVWKQDTALPVSGKSLGKIYRLFSMSRLKKRCMQSMDEIFADVKAAGGSVHGEGDERYAFLDNGANILAVAHCDFVGNVKQQFGAMTLGGETRVYSGTLDDRLGVYTVLDLLPRMNIKVDVLLTDGEETGKSTAKFFKAGKKYRWMVEFDRKEDDVVTYSYRSPTWNKALGTIFNVGRGAYSDICALERLGCCGVNVGIGYEYAHSDRCSAPLPVYLEQMVRFREFWKEYHGDLFIHEEEKGPSFPFRGRYNTWSSSGESAPAEEGKKKFLLTEGTTDGVEKRSAFAVNWSGIAGVTEAGPPSDETVEGRDDTEPYEGGMILPPPDTTGEGEAITLFECSECLLQFEPWQSARVDLNHVQCPECGCVLLVQEAEDLIC